MAPPTVVRVVRTTRCRIIGEFTVFHVSFSDKEHARMSAYTQLLLNYSLTAIASESPGRLQGMVVEGEGLVLSKQPDYGLRNLLRPPLISISTRPLARFPSDPHGLQAAGVYSCLESLFAARLESTPIPCPNAPRSLNPSLTPTG